MSRILVGVAVLLVAGTAMAETTMSLSSDKASVMPGDVFTVTLHLQTDIGLIGWNAKFLDPAGFAAVPSYLGSAAGWDTSTAGAAVGWTTNVLPLNTSNGTRLLGSSPTGASAGSADVFQMVLTVPAAQPLGTVFVTATETAATDVDYNDIVPVVAALPIEIVPEPVSALLLLAGLPMLRRRR
jgi:hypothetical protein